MKQQFKFLKCFILLVIMLLVSLPICSQAAQAIIIDHTCTDLSQIPETWINQLKSQLRVSYGHTSHGSQPVTGMEVIMNSGLNTNHLYDFNTNGAVESGVLSLADSTPEGDLGYNGDTTWADSTRTYLNDSGNDRNVVVWSWCAGVSDNTEGGINTYLSAMNQLETQYPSVNFVYMTGHLDGTGESGNLNIRNNQIRSYCRANNKILFDFADIESYDPSGNYYLNLGADDGCYYNDWANNWAQEWCAARSGSDLCSDCGYEDCCAHSQPLNCNLKARAFWWLLARIAGWDGGGVAPPAAPTLTIATSGTSVTLSWNAVSGATGYTLSYAPFPYTGPETIRSFDMGSQTTISVDLWEGAAFYVAVQAYNNGGSSNYSNIVYFVIQLSSLQLQPQDFTYQGAFRLPSEFAWGSRGASYYPDGNGGLGSLLITGSDQRPAEFAEVSIPSPATAANWQDLPEASMLCDMTEFDGDLIENQLDPTTTYASGIEYVPQQGSQTSDKIYGSADWWYAVSVNTFPTIWFSEMDGSNPRGLFHVGPEVDPFYGRKMGDYLFTLPSWYADLYLGGRTLVTGKCRGVPPQGSMGPTLFAFHPWQTEEPSGDLDAVAMLWYRALYPDCAGPNVGEKGNCDYPEYTMCDKWLGGSFVESGQKRAIILLGVKGLGSNRYGQPESGDCAQYQGYHCDPFERQVIFYDVEELAQVAQGNRDPWTVVPYTIWRPQEFFNNQGRTCMEEGGVGGMTQDLVGQRIFMIERGLGDNNAAVVHVWTVSGVPESIQIDFQ